MARKIEANPQETALNASAYQFASPEQVNEFMAPEMREWLKGATIVHIAPPWLPVPHELRNYGGIENVLEAHIAALDAAGVKHQVIIGQPGNATFKNTYGDRITIVTPDPDGIDYTKDLLALKRTDNEAASALELHYAHEAYRWIAAHEDEITVVHDHTDWGRVFGAAINPAVPVVRTEHNSLKPSETTDLIQRMFKRYAERASRRSRRNTGYIGISNYLKTERPDLNWLSGAVYNGVDLSNLVYKDKNAEPIPEEERYVVYLGRVARNKGVHNAIRIANALGLRLVIAGAVEETEEAREYYQQHIKPHLHKGGRIVHYAKGVGLEDKRELLKDASCLLMPGEWDEPFGMVAIEALASGTPVVAYKRGALPEILDQDAGIGHIADSFDDAVAAVRAIVFEGQFSSENCRRQVEMRFSNDAMTAEYVSRYVEQIAKVQPMKLKGHEGLIQNLSERRMANH